MQARALILHRQYSMFPAASFILPLINPSLLHSSNHAPTLHPCLCAGPSADLPSAVRWPVQRGPRRDGDVTAVSRWTVQQGLWQRWRRQRRPGLAHVRAHFAAAPDSPPLRASSRCRRACDQIHGSDRLRRVLGVVLSAGNQLNAGTARGSAGGFNSCIACSVCCVQVSKPC